MNDTPATRRLSLEEQLDQGAPSLDGAPKAWCPHKYEEQSPLLVGELVGVGTCLSDHDAREHPLLHVRTDDGDEFAVRCYHSVLEAEVRKLNPQVGERIGLRYFGMVKGRTSNYHHYRVAAERPTATLEAPAARVQMRRQAEADARARGHAAMTEDDEARDAEAGGKSYSQGSTSADIGY